MKDLTRKFITEFLMAIFWATLAMIIILIIIFIILALITTLVRAENITLNQTGIQAVNVSVQEGQCNPEFTQLLKDANYALGKENDDLLNQINKLEKYRYVTWISLALALFLSIREIYIIRKQRHELETKRNKTT